MTKVLHNQKKAIMFDLAILDTLYALHITITGVPQSSAHLLHSWKILRQ
ncbi:MAG: hypothetical protein ACSLEM_04320 [Candidatus Malihini olakiniferum]